MEIKYEIKAIDEATGEVIYTNWSYSVEGLEEKFYQIDKVLEKYKERLAEEKEELKDSFAE